MKRAILNASQGEKPGRRIYERDTHQTFFTKTICFDIFFCSTTLICSLRGRGRFCVIRIGLFTLSMKTLCPNYDREDALDTVLEVPLPDEMFPKNGCGCTRWANMRSIVKSQLQTTDKISPLLQAKSNIEFLSLLKLVGSPLIPFPVLMIDNPLGSIRNCNIVSC